MKSKKPNRYGVGMRNVSTTVPEEIFEKMETLAANGGLRLTAWARAALIQEARKETVYGLAPIAKTAIHAPNTSNPSQTLPATQEPGQNICELPVPGSSPAPTPRRKSSAK